MTVGLPIFTERLAMRAYEPNDLAQLHEVLYGDPEAMALLGGARDRNGTRAAIERSMAQQAAGGYSFWPVFERESGLLVGEAGLFPLAPGGIDIALGYAFGRDYWGRGYASEAARAVLDEGMRTERSSTARRREVARRASSQAGRRQAHARATPRVAADQPLAAGESVLTHPNTLMIRTSSPNPPGPMASPPRTDAASTRSSRRT